MDFNKQQKTIHDDLVKIIFQDLANNQGPWEYIATHFFYPQQIAGSPIEFLVANPNLRGWRMNGELDIIGIHNTGELRVYEVKNGKEKSRAVGQLQRFARQCKDTAKVRLFYCNHSIRYEEIERGLTRRIPDRKSKGYVRNSNIRNGNY